MGRGFSPLQRYIVTKAATVDRLYYWEILQDYYGWTIHRAMHSVYDPITLQPTGERRHSPGGQRFWPEEIGRERYHKTMVTLSRATARLGQRGLVTCLTGTRSHWSGVEITTEGRRVAATWQEA